MASREAFGLHFAPFVLLPRWTFRLARPARDFPVTRPTPKGRLPVNSAEHSSEPASRSTPVNQAAGNEAAGTPLVQQPLTLHGLQQLIDGMYSHKDSARGIEGTFMWLMEEVGELAAALREGDPAELRGEFADVLAWLATIANVCEIDLGEAIAEKYGAGCPGCGQATCCCDGSLKP